MDPWELSDYFYSLVGRVVVRATALESRLSQLLVLVMHGPPTSASTDDEQYRANYRKWTSDPGTAVADLIEASVPATLPERADLSKHLAACKAALDERHGVAHSVWIALEEGQWLGVRSMRPAKKSSSGPGPDALAIQATEKTLQAQLDGLEQLARWTGIWQNRIEATASYKSTE